MMIIEFKYANKLIDILEIWLPFESYLIVVPEIMGRKNQKNWVKEQKCGFNTVKQPETIRSIKKIATKFGVDELLSPTPLTTPLQLLPTAEKEFEQQKTEQMFPPLLFENFS